MVMSIKRESLKKTESIFISPLYNAIWTNYITVKTNSTLQKSKYRFYEERDKAVKHNKVNAAN